MPTLFDTHVHYNLPPLHATWKTHWQQAQEAGLVGSIVVGTTPDSVKKGLTIAREEPSLYLSAALHPIHTDHTDQRDLLSMREFIRAHHAELTAIGETGLDYFRLSNDERLRGEQIAAQQKAFITHLEMAQEYALPLILHLRDAQTPEAPTPGNAYWDTLTLLEHYWSFELPTVLHCVSGPRAVIAEMLSRGAMIGVGGMMTYPANSWLRAIIADTPTSQLLLETDAPWLAPQPFRGQTCEPRMIAATYSALNDLTGCTDQELLENTRRVFDV